MANVRSARGVLVDFDHLIIKQQLGQTPTTTDVKAREDHVDERLKRRAIRRAQKLAKLAKADIDAELLPEDSDLGEDFNIDDSVEEAAVVTRKQQIKPSKGDKADESNTTK
jgi:hypothetical protein